MKSDRTRPRERASRRIAVFMLLGSLVSTSCVTTPAIEELQPHEKARVQLLDGLSQWIRVSAARVDWSGPAARAVVELHSKASWEQELFYSFEWSAGSGAPVTSQRNSRREAVLAPGESIMLVDAAPQRSLTEFRVTIGRR